MNKGRSVFPRAGGRKVVKNQQGELRNLMKERRKKPDWRSGIFFLLLGLIVCYSSIKLGLGKPSKPGPGFMPFVAGVFLTFLSLLLVLQVLLSESARFWGTDVKLKNAILVLGSMVAYGYLLQKIGFVFVTLGFVTLLIGFIEPQSWRKALLGGAISAAASYLLFDTFLKSQLPRTFLGFF